MLKYNICDPSSQRYTGETTSYYILSSLFITVVYLRKQMPTGLLDWNLFKAIAVESSAKI